MWSNFPKVAQKKCSQKVVTKYWVQYTLSMFWFYWKKLGFFWKNLGFTEYDSVQSESFQKNPISFSTIKMYSIYTELSTS